MTSNDDIAEGPTVYVGTRPDHTESDGELVALDLEDGDVIWTFDEPDARVTGSPVVVDGTVFVGARDEYFYAVDAETGDREWKEKLNHPVLSAPAVVDGTVYVGTGDDGSNAGRLYALDAETGEEYWQYSNPITGSIAACPLVYEGTVYVTAGNPPNWGQLHAVDAWSGEQEWEVVHSGLRPESSPAIYEDTVLATTSRDGAYVRAYDLETGEEQWNQPLGDTRITNSLAVVDDAIYFGENDSVAVRNDVIALDASDEGDEEWRFEQGEDQFRHSSPTVVDDSLFVGCLDRSSQFESDPNGRIYHLDAETGDLHWEYEPGGSVNSTPTVYDGRVLVGVKMEWYDDEDERYPGVFLALDAENESHADVLWDAQIGSVASSPTVVEDPASGDSVCRRMDLATRGQHHDWLGKDAELVAEFVTEPEEPLLLEEVTFDAGPTFKYEGEIDTYEWDLTDDGDIDETGETVTHEFDDTGEHDVTLTVTKADGTEDSVTKTILVEDRPVADGPTVYVGSNDGSVYAVDVETGEEIWDSFTPGGMIHSSPTVVDGTVYVGQDDGTVYALDARTGDIQWEFEDVEDEGNVRSSPTVVDGSVYVGADDGTLYVLDAEDGTLEWCFETDDRIQSSPAVYNGTVYFGNNEPAVYGVDIPTDGTETVGGDALETDESDCTVEDGYWRFEPAEGTNVISSPTVYDGVVYVGVLDGSFGSNDNLYGLDPEDGEVQWATDDVTNIRTAPTIVNGELYIGSSDGSVHGITLADGDGWEFDEIEEEVESSPTVAGNTVYVGSDEGSLGRVDGMVWAIDRTTGDRLWTYELEEDEVRSSPTVYRGTVFVGTDENKLLALDGTTGDPVWRFDGVGSSVVSSPTVVTDPFGDGTSVDSRVRLGTLGHHEAWGGDDVLWPTLEFDATIHWPGNSVEFDASNSETPADEIQEYEWDLTDDSEVDDTEQVASRTFDESGFYRVTLTVTDSAGDEASLTRTVVVGANERVYVPSWEGTVYALDPFTEEEFWTFSEPEWMESSPTVVDDTLYVGSATDDGGSLWAIDVQTGEAVHEFDEPTGEVRSSPTVVNDTAYVGADDGTLYAFDLTDDTLEWEFEDPAGEIFASPAVAEGSVYVGDTNGTVYAVDTADGTVDWDADDPEYGIYSSPTVVDGTVYVGAGTDDGDGEVWAFNADTGDDEWTFDDPEYGVYSSPTVVDGTVYICSGYEENEENGTVWAIDAETGDEQWHYEVEMGDWPYPIRSSPTVYEGQVYVGLGGVDDEAGAVLALDPTDEDDVWVETTPWQEVFSSPTVYDGTLYVGDERGDFFAIDVETGDVTWEFTNVAGTFRASPTVAEGGGHSVGSRIELGTLGHHHEWAEGPPDDDPPDGELSVTVEGDEVEVGTEAEITISAESVEAVTVERLWGDWDVEEEDLDGGTPTDDVPATGAFTIEWTDVQVHASPVLSLLLPAQTYVGGTYEIRVTATDGDESVIDTTTITLT